MVTTCACPVCESGESEFFASIDGYDYLQCGACRSLHIACNVLDDIDRGSAPRLYDEDYWREELRSARERASGVSLVRAGEAILYCRRPVTRFLDVGTGPGYLLDELAKQFPTRQDVFHGVELFPPEEHSSHPNYMRGDVGMLDMTFDAGVCIEVIEHLTPRMLAELARGLARVSTTGTLWLFNTGMPDYVINEDRGYLDPLRRGHVVSYSLPGLAHIFEPHGLRVQALPGKSFAFIAEFQPDTVINDFERRIYHPLAENTSLLQESGLLHQAAFESARAYLYYSLYLKKAISSPTRELLRRSAHSMLPAFMRRRK